MVQGRRPRAATEEKRKRILDATEEIMLKEGYAAVSSRSVATAVGIQAPLVHYYFSTLDDLFVAVLQRRAGRNVERMAEALVVTGTPSSLVGARLRPPWHGAVRRAARSREPSFGAQGRGR